MMGQTGSRLVMFVMVLAWFGWPLSAAGAQGRGSRDPGADTSPTRRSFGTEMPPGGAGSINPMAPSLNLPPGSIAPMPPDGRGSINPGAPLLGAPSGYVNPMPPGGAGSINPVGPPPQPGLNAVQGAPIQGVLHDRPTPRTTSSGKAPVPPGLEPCIGSWTRSRGLTVAEHRDLCAKIWQRPDTTK